MEISPKSRVWIYQSNRPFNITEERVVSDKLERFINQWEAHGSKLTAIKKIRYNRFIILAVDEEMAGASGCSIDKSVNVMKEIEQELNVNLFDRFNIAYRDGQEIKSCNRSEFEKLISEGKITEDTLVFNNLVQTLEELQNNWEIPLKHSWHIHVFGPFTNA